MASPLNGQTMRWKATILALIFLPSFLALLVTLPQPALAAVAFDAVATGTTTTATMTWTHTPAGTPNLVTVGVSIGDDVTVINSVTYGASTTTLIRSDQNPGNTAKSALYYLVNPPGGAQTVQVNFAGAPPAAIGGSITFTGVDTAAPIRAHNGTGANTGSPSVTVTSAADDLVVDVVANLEQSSGTPGAGQTERYDVALNPALGLGSTEPGAASVTMSWTLAGGGPPDWAISTASLRAAGISFDASSPCTPGTGTAFTWSHTTSGSNRLLVVGIAIRNDASQTVASADYANVPLTLIRADTNGQSVRSELWYLVTPATGANTVRVNLTASAKAACGAISLTGVHQSSPLDASNGATGSSTAPSVTVTTVADNAWVVDALAFRSTGNGLPTGTPGAGQTERWSGYTEGGGAAPNVRGKGSTEGPQTPPGGVVMDWSLSASVDWAISAASFLPVGTTTCTALTVTTSDPAGQLWFNATTDTPPGGLWQEVNVSASFQTAATPALSVTNDGPGNCDITIRLMTDPGTGRSMKFNTTNSAPWPSDASKEAPLDPSSVTVCTSIAAAGTCDIWLWADFENALGGQTLADVRVESV